MIRRRVTERAAWCSVVEQRRPSRAIDLRAKLTTACGASSTSNFRHEKARLKAGVFTVESALRSARRADQSNLVGFEFSASMFLIIRPNNASDDEPEERERCDERETIAAHRHRRSSRATPSISPERRQGRERDRPSIARARGASARITRPSCGRSCNQHGRREALSVKTVARNGEVSAVTPKSGHAAAPH
jgi:hypothetical protein